MTTRQHATKVFPLRKGMERKRVLSLRVRWMLATRYLGDKWAWKIEVPKKEKGNDETCLDRNIPRIGDVWPHSPRNDGLGAL